MTIRAWLAIFYVLVLGGIIRLGHHGAVLGGIDGRMTIRAWLAIFYVLVRLGSAKFVTISILNRVTDGGTFSSNISSCNIFSSGCRGACTGKGLNNDVCAVVA